MTMLDIEWNLAIEAAAREVEGHRLALRAMNGESEAWVWPCANSADELIDRIRKLKRKDEA